MLLFVLIVAVAVAIPIAVEQKKHPHDSVLFGLNAAVVEAFHHLIAVVLSLGALAIIAYCMFLLFRLILSAF